MSCSHVEMQQALPALPYCKRGKAGRGTQNKAKLFSHLKKQHPRANAEMKAVRTSERETCEPQQDSHCQQLTNAKHNCTQHQVLAAAVYNGCSYELPCERHDTNLYGSEARVWEVVEVFDSHHDIPSRLTNCCVRYIYQGA